MVARAHTFTIDGLLTRQVGVEVDVRPGLPAFTIVGLADAAVREARERIGAAIRNSGYEFPARRITANLAPGDVPKVGPGLDLALACALLAASGQLPPERLEDLALFGELALDGLVRPSHGTLAVAQATRRVGLRALALAPAGALEAQLVEGVRVLAVERLSSAVRILRGGPGDALPSAHRAGHQTPAPPPPELGEVRGQRLAVEALVIAAAGAHNCLLSGPPGTGKTMLARRLPSILAPLSVSEAVEVARIRSLAGEPVSRLDRARPFRAPHHSITRAGLIGGAQRGRVGEVVLAHNGVLFLDELSEFSRATLEALRQPVEEGRVSIARASHSTLYPTRFMLLGATNPCQCGYAGEGERCGCSENELARHRRRLSGPLLDRMDLVVGLHRVNAVGREEQTESSRRARERVRLARERQAARLRGERIAVNSRMDVRMLQRHVRIDDRGEELLSRARATGLLSARGEHRAVRVARTIADLAGSRRVRAGDLGAALALRPSAILGDGRVT